MSTSPSVRTGSSAILGVLPQAPGPELWTSLTPVHGLRPSGRPRESRPGRMPRLTIRTVFVSCDLLLVSLTDYRAKPLPETVPDAGDRSWPGQRRLTAAGEREHYER
ncbi:MAG: hypothetical protein MZU84_09550 [Sphingobacterium sp.]|nr:hypothetical protein [Sphingobacterium sp.]